jgi:hypothetical protein
MDKAGINLQSFVSKRSVVQNIIQYLLGKPFCFHFSSQFTQKLENISFLFSVNNSGYLIIHQISYFILSLKEAVRHLAAVAGSTLITIRSI